MKVYVVLRNVDDWPEDGGGLQGIEAIFESAEGAAQFIHARKAAEKAEQEGNDYYRDDYIQYYTEIWTVAP